MENHENSKAESKSIKEKTVYLLILCKVKRGITTENRESEKLSKT